MWIALVQMCGGLVLLVFGGEGMVRGAVGLARLARLTPAVIGLTVVALGTSMPELVVSILAALRDSTDIAVGNVVGSNIFNIAAILGLSALLCPLPVQGNTIRLEWPCMLLASLLLWVLVLDEQLSRIEGAFFVIALVVFLAYSVHIARRDVTALEAQELAAEVQGRSLDTHNVPWGRCLLFVGGGILILMSGAHLMLEGAIIGARSLGISERVIGLTIVGAGTGLPELATSMMAAYRRQPDIAVTNIIGSNMFNILAILGLSSAVRPLAIHPSIVRSDLWWMIGFSVLLLPLMYFGQHIRRLEGLALVAAYCGYLTFLILY